VNGFFPQWIVPNDNDAFSLDVAHQREVLLFSSFALRVDKKGGGVAESGRDEFACIPKLPSRVLRIGSLANHEKKVDVAAGPFFASRNRTKQNRLSNVFDGSDFAGKRSLKEIRQAPLQAKQGNQRRAQEILPGHSPKLGAASAAHLHESVPFESSESLIPFRRVDASFARQFPAGEFAGGKPDQRSDHAYRGSCSQDFVKRGPEAHEDKQLHM
ncbi:MAG TPA: hypothetical protein VGB18_08465, partial [Candidatus Thermoplasmatota archaeon]